MFIELLALAGLSSVGAQAVSGVSVAETSGGACGFHALVAPATIRVSWTSVNVDAVAYQLKVYENNILVATLSGSAAFWDKEITGYVSASGNDTTGDFDTDWTYRVDVVRISSGNVVSTATAAAWVRSYGECA